MKRKNTFLIFLTSGLLSIGVLLAAVNSNGIMKISKANETAYSLKLDSSNAIKNTISSAADNIVKTNLGNNVIFTYFNVSYQNNSHCLINDDGYITNKDQITSISKFFVSFTGDLIFRTSFDSYNWGAYNSLISEEIYNFPSHPYFVEIRSIGVSTLKQAYFEYTCIANPRIEDVHEFDVGSYDFWDPNNINNTTETTLVDKTFLNSLFSNNTPKLAQQPLIQNVEAYYTFQKRYGGIGLGEEDNNATFIIDFAEDGAPNKIVAEARYVNDSADLIINGVETKLTKGRIGELSDIENPNVIIYESKDPIKELVITTNNVVALYRLNFYIQNNNISTPIDEIGFTATDQNKDSYLTNSIYSKDNDLKVVANFSDGSSKSLLPTEYSYQIKNSSGEIIDPNEEFSTSGSYFLTVFYKNYINQVIVLSVGQYHPKLTVKEIHLNKSKTEYTTNEKISLSDLSADIIMSDGESMYEEVPYEEFSSYSLEIYLLTPSNYKYDFDYAVNVAGNWQIYVVSQDDDSVNAYINIHVSKYDFEGYLLATSVDDLYEGCEIVIAANSRNLVASSFSSSSFKAISQAFSNDKTYINDLSSSATIFTLGKSGNYYTLSTNSKLLGNAKQTNKLYLGSGTTTWDISFAKNGDATILNTDTRYRLQYYALTARFAAYLLNQVSIQIYYKPAINNEVLLEKLEVNDFSLKVGEAKELSISYTPFNTTQTEVDIRSNSTNVYISGNKIIGNSEGISSLTIASIANPSIYTTCKVTILPSQALEKTNLDYKYCDYIKNNYHDLDACPSLGNSRILVIPVWFTDSSNYISNSKKEDIRNDIQLTYFGSNEDTDWFSVKSYYETISRGKLKLDGVVAPWFECGKSSLEFYSTSTGEDETNNLVTSAVNWYKTISDDPTLKSFDTDNNGHIDGVALIYGAPDYQAMGRSSDNMWAYCYWLQNNNPSITSPTPNVFFWGSYDFMFGNGSSAYNATALTNYGNGDTSHCKLDAHTYIHEMGHILGLEDYYDYSNQFTPAGKTTMQDFNVGGHDPYSRMALGWVEPYIARDNGKITLRPFEESGDLLLLSPNFSNSPFDEYLLVELYTPTSVNHLDAEFKYDGYPQLPNTYGIRIWHIDARLIYTSTTSFSASRITTNPLISLNRVYHMMSNTYYKYGMSSHISYLGSSYSDYNILQYIRNDQNSTYKPIDSITSENMFKSGDFFDMSLYANQFVQTGSFNSNIDLGFTLYFESVTSEKAVITISKK